MKRICSAVSVLLFIAVCACLLACSTKDARTVDAYIRDRYGYDVPIIYTQHHPTELTTDRTGSAYVQIVRTVSCGEYGKTHDGYMVKYNKRVKRGKHVTSYLIYNPNTNEEDDVVAVVDNGKVR